MTRWLRAHPVAGFVLIDARLILAWRLLQATYAVAALVVVCVTWRWWSARAPQLSDRAAHG